MYKTDKSCFIFIFIVEKSITFLLIPLKRISVYQDSRNIYNQISLVLVSVKLEAHLFLTVDFIFLIPSQESPIIPLSQKVLLLSIFSK